MFAAGFVPAPEVFKFDKPLIKFASFSFFNSSSLFCTGQFELKPPFVLPPPPNASKLPLRVLLFAGVLDVLFENGSNELLFYAGAAAAGAGAANGSKGALLFATGAGFDAKGSKGALPPFQVGAGAGAVLLKKSSTTLFGLLTTTATTKSVKSSIVI